MSVQSALERYKNLLVSVGKPVANALFPNDFELYFVALELIDSTDKTIEYFVFPINPSDMSESKPSLVNFKKTVGGITTITTDTFVPTTISISGDFGRKFKFLLNRQIINFSAFNLKESTENFTSKKGFDPSIKNGYGCTKILERIINKSTKSDEFGKPHSLYFYNLSLGNSYLVKPVNITLNQNEQSNMIWKYNLQLKSLARIEDIDPNQILRNLTATTSANAIIQKSGNRILSNTTNFLNFGANISKKTQKTNVLRSAANFINL